MPSKSICSHYGEIALKARRMPQLKMDEKKNEFTNKYREKKLAIKGKLA